MPESIQVKLPDGSVKEVPKGTTALDVARGISPRLADAAVVAKIAPANGHRAEAERPKAEAPSVSAAAPQQKNNDGFQLVDLTRPLDQNVELRILTDRDPEALQVYRHSSA